MKEQTIRCPKCQNEIPLTEALSNQIRQQLQTEVDQRSREQEARFKAEKESLESRAKELEQQRESLDTQITTRLKEASAQLSAEARRKAEEEFALKLDAANNELNEKRNRIKEFQQKELDLARERDALSEQRAGLELEKQRQRETVRLELEKEYQKKQEMAVAQAREDSTRKAREQGEQKLAEAQEELESRKKQIKVMQAQELCLRKEKQALEDAKTSFELEIQRRMDAERNALVENAKKSALDEQKLTLRQKEDLIHKLQEQLGDAQRQIAQGSQERQGEMLEEELITVLRQTFPLDQFEEIKRGARGADVLQTVRNPQGKSSGRILWESKNTKNFDKNWLTKLKKDQQESSAELAVLMTMTMPNDIDQFGNIDDVWVTDFKSALSLCAVLRQALIMVERERLIATHQDGLKDIIYQYMTGQEFTTRVKMIYSAYQGMMIDLDAEKRSMLRIWKNREKRIALVLDNIAGMRGELEGIVGGQKVLPAFEPLSLEAIDHEGISDTDN